ncbi:MAG: succinate dehydrogenase, hydrophobic membrane anchor protein [Rhizomicrobium sp.]|jgi:succinate dehydrogenase / fumarate reductase membrane anchor subunit
MTTRTPLSQVEGLGASRTGTSHFWRQRITAMALIPLTIWFVWSVLTLIGADRDTALAFLKMPANAVLMGLFIVITAIHMTLGLQMVIEDYVHGEGQKIVLLVLNQFFAWLVAAATIYALVRIAL